MLTEQAVGFKRKQIIQVCTIRLSTRSRIPSHGICGVSNLVAWYLLRSKRKEALETALKERTAKQGGPFDKQFKSLMEVRGQP